MKKPKDIDKELRAKGIVTTPTRLQILKDRLDNPKTSEKERWNILMFLLEDRIFPYMTAILTFP